MLAWLLAALLAAHATEWPGDPKAVTLDWSSTDTGVEYYDDAAGTEPKVEEGARVVVHYVGMLADGTVFDSSVDRGTPFEFKIGEHRVIRGWEDGLVGAGPGSKRRLVIPPDQGYGDRAGGPIPPGSTLYFDVQVLEVYPPRKPPAAPKSVDPGAFKKRQGVPMVELAKGKGNKPTKGERVCVDWTAWSGGQLLEHTLDTDRCRWFRYEEGKVVDGLFLGIKTLREGGIRQIRVPAELATAPNRPEGAAPGEPILYEVQLVEARPKSR